MAGENSKSSATLVPPTRRIRPHWWAVLAVSVSLLALVAATVDHPKAPAGTTAAPGASVDQRSGTTTTAAPSVSTTTTTTNTAATATTDPPESPNAVTPPSSSLTPGATGGTHAVVPRSTPTPATPTTTTTTTAAATGGSSVAAAVHTVPTIYFPGALQQPDDATATYAFSGSGAMQASATSTSTVPLLLTVSCPAGSVEQAGSAPVVVVIPDADGPCDVVLKETVVQYAAVPYTITIGPAGG